MQGNIITAQLEINKLQIGQNSEMKHIHQFVFIGIQSGGVQSSKNNQQVTSESFSDQLEKDLDFQRWIFLYHNKIKNTDQYKDLYRKLRNRYKISPIQIANQYT